MKKEANLKCHKNFGYDYFYIDWDAKKIYAYSGLYDDWCDELGEFSNENDLKIQIARCMHIYDEFFYEYPEKWNCAL